MRIDRLLLRDFRSYESMDGCFHPNVNLIVGENAQGKTNLLEAIIYLSQGYSYRTRKEEEMIRWDAEYARLQGNISSEKMENELVYVLYRGARRRQLAKNGVKLKSSAEASGVLNTVLFCPEDLQLLKEGSSMRRRFLDNAISQLRPQYKKAIADYQKLYNGKVRILRDRWEKPGMLQVLPEYNRQMAILSAVIIEYRASYCRRLSEKSEKYHDSCSGGREKLTLEYQTVSTVDDIYASKKDLYEKIMEHQEAHYQAELDSSHCLTGIHKDDFEVMLNGRPIRSYGSQGQTRTAAIALKLSEREIARDEIGEEPVLLLDDVLSELDAGRQNFILNEIRSGQVFITCCEPNKLTRAGKTFLVENHTLREKASCM